MEVFEHLRRVPVQMFWARGDPQGRPGSRNMLQGCQLSSVWTSRVIPPGKLEGGSWRRWRTPRLLAEPCQQEGRQQRENKTTPGSQPVRANDVRTLTEIMRWDDMKVVIYHLTFKHVREQLLWLMAWFLCQFLSGCVSETSVQVGERQHVLVTEESFDAQYYVAHNKFYEQVRKGGDSVRATPTSPAALTE